tara:strand:+ start:1155 stop:1370 length:216 start_codon:yes stop_codon:yes gene_type:complete
MDEIPCCTLSRDAIDKASSSSANRPHKFDSAEAQLLSELIWRLHMEERHERLHAVGTAKGIQRCVVNRQNS